MKTIKLHFRSHSDKIAFNQVNGFMPSEIIAEGPDCLPVWGVSLYKDGNHVGYVSKSMDANCTAGREDTELQKLLLNRVAAALWRKQPRWS